MECAVVSVTFWLSVVTIALNVGMSAWVFVRHRRFERWALASVQHAVDVFCGKVEREDRGC